MHSARVSKYTSGRITYLPVVTLDCHWRGKLWADARRA
jgi:hypothetical protein